MIKVIVAALLLTALTVIIHGIGTVYFSRRMQRLWAARRDKPRHLVAELFLVARFISALLLLHLSEAVVWALFYLFQGLFPTLEAAAYFSLTSYATLGYGDVVLAPPWRLLGPLEASVGVLVFGWSTGVLIAVLGKVYRQEP